MGLCYKAIVQAILLYGAEMWTLMQPLTCLLNSFHHCCACYLARMVNTQDGEGKWIMPASSVALEKAGLFPIEEYIQRRVNTFLPFIQSRAIYRECHPSRATQAAATHPCWWSINPGLPTFPAPMVPELEPADPNLENADPAQDGSLPLPRPPPR